MSTLIYIPTRGRLGFWRQPTLRKFLEYSSYKPILICPPEEVDHHKQYYRRVFPCPIPVNSINGIAITRQFILDHSSADLVIQVDDDMRFAYRPNPLETKLVACHELDSMIEAIQRAADRGYIHGGVHSRQNNSRKTATGGCRGVIQDNHLYVDCERVNNFHYYCRQEVLKTGVRFDTAPAVAEDMYVTLSLLLLGYPNRVVCDYVWNQTGSGTSGGCSLYRTPEVQTQAAKWLASLYPEVVKLTTGYSVGSNKQTWQGMKERTDVKIYWRKAWEQGRRLYPQHSATSSPKQTHNDSASPP